MRWLVRFILRFAVCPIFGIDDAIVGAAIGGGLSIGSTAMNNANQMKMMREQQAFNKHEAEMQREWAGGLSSTAYQRATTDMKLAGINPMLAFMKGGADTPGGATASSGMATTEALPLGKAFNDTISTAFEKKRLDADLAMRGAQTLESVARAATEHQKAANYASATDAQRMENLQTKEGLSDSRAAAAFEASGRKKQAQFDNSANMFDNIVKRASAVLGTIGSAFSGFLKGGGGGGPVVGGPGWSEQKMNQAVRQHNMWRRDQYMQ